VRTSAGLPASVTGFSAAAAAADLGGETFRAGARRAGAFFGSEDSDGPASVVSGAAAADADLLDAEVEVEVADIRAAFFTGLSTDVSGSTAGASASFALRPPKIRVLFLSFSFVSTIAGALLVPGAGNRATPPGIALMPPPALAGCR
jgi:hypothetical protein